MYVYELTISNHLSNWMLGVQLPAAGTTIPAPRWKTTLWIALPQPPMPDPGKPPESFQKVVKN